MPDSSVELSGGLSPDVSADVGTQADVDEIMKKYDRESNTRPWTGVPGIVVKVMLAAFSVFMIYMNLFVVWDERIRRSLFLGLVIIFVFILYPAGKNIKQKPNSIPFYDVIIALAGSFSFFYFTFNSKAIIDHGTRISTLEVVLGVIGIIVLAECCRRVTGIPILAVATCFVIYAAYFFATNGRNPTFYTVLRKIIYNLFYTTTGVIGTPVGVCSTYIVLFIIFGAFLESTGISDFFIACANCVAGSASGGPAKVAVISSALCGMVSGSSVGNTVTTGSVTIPMMKKTGYPGEFAGAVEAAASTGGQIMPPIMGAAAFLMAEMVGVPYSNIVVRAILPAVLYFLGIFLMVHLRAKRLGLKGIPREDLPKVRDLLPKIYLLIPLIALVYLIISGYTMSR
ncbi:MAG: TRAP transporter fused permease subunit, partial [Lachnospiraceae bacterium]|nr:TRAP transporter fused permease subunit [Lachnospiraceae bacterium]